ncbi:MAG: NAD-binding protein [Bdellovibrionota bacterium]
MKKLSTPVFILFFTALGITLDISVLKATWHIAFGIAGIRLVAMYLACYIGGTVAGIKQEHSRLLGLAFITQAGISISLAKEIEIMYLGWGSDFSTLLVGIIIINTLLGPWFTKFAIQKVGEAHPKGLNSHSRSSRKVIIFGVENHSRALARTLHDHDWNVVLADIGDDAKEIAEDDFEYTCIKEISIAELKRIGADKVDTIVTLLDNESNYEICDLAYEHFGTEHLIARIPDGQDTSRFYQLGVMVIEPSSAMLNLLDHCIRSPSAASLVLGQDKENDVIEVEVSNPELHGMAIRELSLPSDIIVLSIRRKGKLIFTHGYSRFKLKDEVTLVGTNRSLNEVSDRFED